MAKTRDITTLICLFHHRDHASAATDDLFKQGIPPASINVIGIEGSTQETGITLDDLGLPARDREHLLKGLHESGVIVAVLANSNNVATVEKIFGQHKAEKIDEAAAPARNLEPGASASEGEVSIPIVEEELLLGKRTVDQGGVRVYRRVIEIPVEETVDLREQHVVVERHAVDRPVTDADVALQGDQIIELTEIAEEAVVGKTAHVVEEVVVGKTATERTEHIHDTVRRTEVEVEEVVPDRSPLSQVQ